MAKGNKRKSEDGVRYEAATTRYVGRVKHDGRSYDVVVDELPVTRDTVSGDFIYGPEADEAINGALRVIVGLLSPAELRLRRTRLGLTQEQLAKALGLAAETVSRIETGSRIQSKSTDRLLRAYFGVQQVRALFAALDTKKDPKSEWAVIRPPEPVHATSLPQAPRFGQRTSQWQGLNRGSLPDYPNAGPAFAA